MSKVFFANSGSEANDTAVKLVWYYHNAIGKPQKKKIISRLRGYHGVTVASASLTGLPNNHRDFDLPIAGILHTDCPGYYRFGQPARARSSSRPAAPTSLEKLIQREGPDTVGAFFAEPVMGAGGCIVPPRDLLREDPGGAAQVRHPADRRRGDLRLRPHRQHVRLRDLRHQAGHDDDGEAAVGRLSADLGADDQREDLPRDVRESEKIGTFGHGFTYGGHPVAAAVALETLKIYEERDIVGHVRGSRPRFQERLQAARPSIRWSARRAASGLVAALELVEDKATRKNFAPAAGVAAYAGAARPGPWRDHARASATTSTSARR